MGIIFGDENQTNFFNKINDATWGDIAEQVYQVCVGVMIGTDCIPRRTNAVGRVQLWVEFDTHYIEVGCPFLEGIRVSTRCVQFGVDEWLFHHDVVIDMIWLCSPLVQLQEACFQFQDSMMTATAWEREFLAVGSSQSKVRSNCWLAWVRLLLQQCRLPSYRPGLRDSEPT